MEDVKTDSHPTQPGNGSSAARRQRSPQYWVLLAVGALLTAAVVALAALAATYQPIAEGGQWGIGYPGMPSGTGLRFVNNFLHVSNGDTYIPPQRGVFTVTESFGNSGPEAVTIETVTILSPQQQTEEAQGQPPWPLTPAGAVHWRDEGAGPGLTAPTSGNSVVGLTLAPGQDIAIGIPLRISEPCYEPDSSTGADAFYVKVRYLSFTHWVAIPFQAPLLLQQPFPASRQPAKDFVCPST
jgi:hypothetical protein